MALKCIVCKGHELTYISQELFVTSHQDVTCIPPQIARPCVGCNVVLDSTQNFVPSYGTRDLGPMGLEVAPITWPTNRKAIRTLIPTVTPLSSTVKMLFSSS